MAWKMHGPPEKGTHKSIQNTNKRLLESKAILNDLKDEFAGRLGEAQIPLQVLKETALKIKMNHCIGKINGCGSQGCNFRYPVFIKESGAIKR